jgi:hypothetical protein
VLSLIGGLLAGWVLLTVVKNTHDFKCIQKFDILGLIPGWKFFSPLPVNFDLVLLYRAGRLEDFGSPSANWKLALHSYRERWWHFVINPHLRSAKTVLDLNHLIIDLAKEHEYERYNRSMPIYALLSHSVRENGLLGQLGSDERVQFAICRVQNGRQMPISRMIFLSDQFPL